MTAKPSPSLSTPDSLLGSAKKHLRWLFAPLIGGALFVLFTTLAMMLYPGGTFLDPSTEGYNFAQNFFSDLGRSVARTGDTNFGSQICFAIAAASCGILLIPAFLVIPQLFRLESRARSLTRLSAIISVPTGIMYMMVGFAPADTLKLMHYGSMFLALIGSIIILLFYNIAILSGTLVPRIYAYLNFLLIGLIAFFLFYYAFGPPDTTLEGLIVRVLLQKVTIYGEIIEFVIQGIGAYKHGKGA